MKNALYTLFFILNIFLFSGDCHSQNNNTFDYKNKTEDLKIIALGSLSNKKAILNDPLIPEISQYIQEKYGTHTVILQGSRARGTETNKSDYNLIALQTSGEKKNYKEFFKGAFLDIVIYPQNGEKEAALQFPLAWQEAVVLVQPHHEGEDFIRHLKIAFDYSSKPTVQEKKNLIHQLRINLGRGRENEIREDLYRRRFLVFALANYFPLHDLTYMGPRKSLEWLKQNDPSTYIAFKEALVPNASLEKLSNLLTHVTSFELEVKSQIQSSNSHKQKEKYDYSKDPLLPEIVQHIQKTYGVSTVILYGSRMQGTASEKSDYDFIALQRPGVAEKDIADVFKGVPVDIHLLSEGTTSLIGFLGCIDGAKVLTQKHNFGDQFLKDIRDTYDRGFLTSNAIKQKVIDGIKMHQWKMSNTLEGYYYQNLLLSAILEHYFTLRNLYYTGPRGSFRWLKKNDLPAYYAFEKALKPDSSIESMNELVDVVIGGTVFDEKEGKEVAFLPSS